MASSVLLVALLGYGSVALAKDRAPRGSFKAVLVQQNVDSWGSANGELSALEAAVSLARRAIEEGGVKPDLVIFSETALRRDYDDFAYLYRRVPMADPLIPFLAEFDTRLFTGAPELFELEGQLEATNSVILIGPDGVKEGSYAKMHPVPFAEAIPFWDVRLSGASYKIPWASLRVGPWVASACSSRCRRQARAWFASPGLYASKTPFPTYAGASRSTGPNCS